MSLRELAESNVLKQVINPLQLKIQHLTSSIQHPIDWKIGKILILLTMLQTPPKFNETVILLAKLLKGHQYAFRGTTSLVLQGIEMNVSDIDIVCDKSTALLCNSVLKKYCIEEVTYSESPKFKSFFGKFEINGILVEIMGNWQIKDTKGNWSKVYNARGSKGIIYEGVKIQVTSVSEELEASAKMGRWNAYHKIKRQLKPEEAQIPLVK